MSRAPIPAKVQVSVAIRQRRHALGGLRCSLCYEPIYSDSERVLEHMTPRALRIELGLDPDDASNLEFVHAKCAKIKTIGTKATCASGDLHKIAKAKRLAKAQEEHKAVVARVMKRAPGKIKSRGFPKGLRKRMSGKVERV